MIQSLLERGAARTRVEIEPAALGFPITALLTLDVQPRHIPAALAALGGHPTGRFTVMAAGPASVIHHGAIRDEDHLEGFVTDDLGARPGIGWPRHVDRAVRAAPPMDRPRRGPPARRTRSRHPPADAGSR